MQIYTKARAAVSILIDMAIQNSGRQVALATLAKRNDMSLPYLESLFSKLRSSGIVRSVRGPGGGYLLGRPLADIQVTDIVLAVDGDEQAPIKATRRGANCLGQEMWASVNSRAMDYLSKITLADLVADEIRRERESLADEDAGK